jgi:hypothetical protein
MSVHYEVDGPIVVVTLDRPEVANAIDRPTADALAEAFRRFDADPSLSVAVLAGANGKFSGPRLSPRRWPASIATVWRRSRRASCSPVSIATPRAAGGAAT